MRDLPDVAECRRRLELIFPPNVVENTIVSGQLAATAVFVFLYVDAIDKQPIRPSTVLWMGTAIAHRQDAGSRGSYYAAAMRGKRTVQRLVESWGAAHDPWYGDNSRETLRDEIFRLWQGHGAVLRDQTVPTTSSRPAWTMTPEFAALFDPVLGEEELATRIAAWQARNLSIAGRTRIALAQRAAQTGAAVTIALPDGTSRRLHPGESSLILKGIIEELAPAVLGQPAVLTISESATKIDVVDAGLLRGLGIQIAADRLLPDAILFDADDSRFYFVEAVASDGEIHEQRKAELLAWATRHGIAPEQCGFISGFLSRTAPVFRKRVASLAWGTLVWFLDEPGHVIRLEDLRR